jgi:hypothetical protein
MASHRLAESSQESTTLSRCLEELGTISCPEKIITFVSQIPLNNTILRQSSGARRTVPGRGLKAGGFVPLNNCTKPPKADPLRRVANKNKACKASRCARAVLQTRKKRLDCDRKFEKIHRPMVRALFRLRNALMRSTLGKSVSLAFSQTLKKTTKKLTAGRSTTELRWIVS